MSYITRDNAPLPRSATAIEYLNWKYNHHITTSSPALAEIAKLWDVSVREIFPNDAWSYLPPTTFSLERIDELKLSLGISIIPMKAVVFHHSSGQMYVVLCEDGIYEVDVQQQEKRNLGEVWGGVERYIDKIGKKEWERLHGVLWPFGEASGEIVGRMLDVVSSKVGKKKKKTGGKEDKEVKTKGEFH